MWLISLLVISIASLRFVGLLAGDSAPAAPKSIYLPKSMRTEGKLIWAYKRQDTGETVQHHLAFSELIDGETKRSLISIGYVGHAPLKYQARPGGQTMTVDPVTGGCQMMKDRPTFVPELLWFVEMLYSRAELHKYLETNPHEIGPSGLIRMILLLNKDAQTSYGGKVVHRNLDCHVASLRFDRDKCQDVKVDLYIPDESLFGERRVPMFSVREVATGDGAAQLDTTFTLDYFDIEPLRWNAKSASELELVEQEFNLFLASGCSEFLPQAYTYTWNVGRSFLMRYYQSSAMAQFAVAYDNQFNLLRKEEEEAKKESSSFSIWDINQDLLYHVDLRDRMANNSQDYPARPCSVSRVADVQLGASLRPYNSKAIILIDLLGAYHMAFVGRGRVRNMPCAIYETILAEPPKLFALNSETSTRNSGGQQFDYIVQFHLLRSDLNSNDWSPASKLDENFWPARVVLHKRHKKSGQINLLDQLEVFDFHWGLLGWNRKPSELFMAPECFEDQREELSLELAIKMDKYDQQQPGGRSLIAHNKFKLENDLLNEVSSLLHISRLHVTQMQLRLEAANILANFVISVNQEHELKTKLIYCGQGHLYDGPQEGQANNRLTLNGLTEQSCVSFGSLISDVSFVVHCPPRKATHPDDQPQQSTCTAVYGQSAPAIKISVNTGLPDMGAEANCQVYRFTKETREEPQVDASLAQWTDLLTGHKFEFKALDASAKEDTTFAGLIEDFDLTRQVKLLTISHYKYSIEGQPSGQVRHFDSMSYRNVGDCAKICNLDVACKSYSFCGPDGAKQYPANELCILSSLDVRASKLDETLVRSTLTADNKVVVGAPESARYTLELASSCNIHERDYLSMYSLTDETISLAAQLAVQFRSEQSALACAKWSVELEEQHPEHHVAMFAFCPSSNSCLMDENLFVGLATTNQTSSTATNKQQDQEDDADDDRENVDRPRELQCQVYRRKYQTYFRLSAEVVQRNKMYQLELGLSSVEECARTCWNRFGQICSSFDYCSPRDCLINIIPNESDAQLVEAMTRRRELRAGCLHYERDLRLDKLRLDHLIGRHQVLVVSHNNEGLTFASLLLNLLLFSLLAACFTVGFLLAGRAHSRLMQTNNGFSRFAGDDSPLFSTSLATIRWNKTRSTCSNAFNKLSHDDGSGAIRMEEIKRIERPNGAAPQWASSGALEKSSQVGELFAI